MESGGRYILRSLGVVLISSGVGCWFVYSEWGTTTLPAMLVATVTAYAMGWIGFVTSRRGTVEASTQVTPVVASLLGGVLANLTALALVWWLGNKVFEPEWGSRLLFATLLLYLPLLVVKVITLQGELRRRVAQSSSGDKTTE